MPDLTDGQKEILEIWASLDTREKEIFDSIMARRGQVGEKLEKILFPDGVCEDYDADPEAGRIKWNKLRKRITEGCGKDMGEYHEESLSFR